MSYNLNYLEAFLSLSETLSFTQTARTLKISQPSVSRQIQLLEDQLQTQLFVRGRNRVHLSPAGHQLRTNLAPLLRDVVVALGDVRKSTESLHGNLSFGSLAEMGQSTFMGALLDFQTKYPEVALYIEYSTEIEIKRKIKSGGLDFGIITSLEDSEQLRAYPLFQERVVLLTRTANQKQNIQNKESNFVIYRKGDPLFESYFKIHEKKVGFKQRRTYVAVNSHRSMLEALLTRDSYAVMPYLSAKSLIDDGKLKVISELELKNPVFLAALESKHTDQRSSLFRKHILAFCRELEKTRGRED